VEHVKEPDPRRYVLRPEVLRGLPSAIGPVRAASLPSVWHVDDLGGTSSAHRQCVDGRRVAQIEGDGLERLDFGRGSPRAPSLLYESTVKVNVASILTKLGVHYRVGIVIAVRQHGHVTSTIARGCSVAGRHSQPRRNGG